jgi:CheY-like chemotaxis protein
VKKADSHLEVIVADKGIGITPEFLPHVFDRFRQADSSITRRYGGLGLGLSIVKQLIELHGGTVTAASDGEGRGTTFTVSLPLTAIRGDIEPVIERRKMPAKDVLLKQSSSGGDIRDLRILVVDDEVDARTLIKRLLEDLGAIVTMAASAEEGLGALVSQKFDLLISDVGMPGEDGYSFMQRVRALNREQGGGIPALALTAYARSEDRTRSILAGFQMHLSKPVSPDELIAVVGSLARRRP